VPGSQNQSIPGLSPTCAEVIIAACPLNIGSIVCSPGTEPSLQHQRTAVCIVACLWGVGLTSCMVMGCC